MIYSNETKTSLELIRSKALNGKIESNNFNDERRNKQINKKTRTEMD